MYIFQISTAKCLAAVRAHPSASAYSVKFDPVERLLYSGGGDGILNVWDLKLKKTKSYDLNPSKAAAPHFTHHPLSMKNSASVMCQRKTLFEKPRERLTGPMAIQRKNASGKMKEEDKSGPKKGSELRGEGDVWTGNKAVPPPKLKHIALLRKQKVPSSKAAATATVEKALKTVREDRSVSGSDAGGGVGGDDATCAGGLVVAVGTGRGSISMVDVTRNEILPPSRQGHCAHVYGLSAHPTLGDLFLTVGQDAFVCVWDTNTMACVSRRILYAPAKSVAVSPNGVDVAIGLFNGVCLIVKWRDLMDTAAFELKISHVIHDCDEDIDDLKYSPDGSLLAVGSHDQYVDVYNVAGTWNTRTAKMDEYTVKFRLKGHTSYITHLDWSKDGKIIQSNCGAYEILYWDVRSGRQIRNTLDSLEADTDWDTWTCVLGFPVMGIWNAGSDGTDVNSCDVDEKKKLIVTADDFGNVNLMRYPAVAKCAAKKSYGGHAAHVMNTRFLKNGKFVVSVGGKDRAVMVWRLDRNEDQEDSAAKPKPKQGVRWMPQGGWDNGRELEHVGAAYAMTDMFANAGNPRAVAGWMQKDDGKMAYTEPEMPYGDYAGRYNDGYSSRA